MRRMDKNLQKRKLADDDRMKDRYTDEEGEMINLEALGERKENLKEKAKDLLPL
jgi:hypothetical protein